MSLTSVLFNYNVAKIIDTPWNTIINGLNYTKTSLSPLGLRYTLANNYDTGMLLKEVAGNSINVNGPMEDFSWSNTIRDYNDSDKYWVLNTSHKSINTTGPYIYCAKRYVDENGFEYSNLEGIGTKARNCGQIFYEDGTYIYSYVNQTYYSSGNTAYIYRWKKTETGLSSIQSYSYTNGVISLLDVKDGHMYFLAQYGTSNITREFMKIEISSGLQTSIYTHTTSSIGVLTSYPSNLVDEEIYVKDMPTNKWYRFKFNESRTTLTPTTITCDKDESVFTSTGTSYVGQIKRFNHIYKVGNEKYLVVITLNSYHYQKSEIVSRLQVYKIVDDTLERVQSIVLNGLSLIPKNDWNTLFIGTTTGIRVFNWDILEKRMAEKPTIYTTCQQFGFDIDDRLWIMDGIGNVKRFTYNQPLSVDYKFELPKYEIGTEIVETYADVRVMNYMGDNLTAKLKLKAIGNFTFINNQKELELTLTSDSYTRLPIYLNGTGKYEIRLKD